MTELIDHINELIVDCIPDVTTHGLCHLINDTGGHYPALVAKSSQRITPDDRHTITLYHRLLNGNGQVSEEFSFGRRLARQNNQAVRTVIFLDLDDDPSLIDDIINALPDAFEVEGYKYANVGPEVNLIRDRDAIWDEEFGEAYASKYQKRFHVYAVEWQLEYIKCPVCQTVSP